MYMFISIMHLLRSSPLCPKEHVKIWNSKIVEKIEVLKKYVVNMVFSYLDTPRIMFLLC